MRAKPWVGAALGWTTAFLALLPIIVIMLGAAFFPAAPKPDWAPYLSFSWVGAMATGIAALVSWTPWSKKAMVTSQADKLTFTSTAATAQEAKQIAVDDIVHGTVIPGFGATLSLKDGSTIDVETKSTRDAEKLAAACGLGSSERRFETKLAPSWRRAGAVGAGVLGLCAYAVALKPSPSQLGPIDAAFWAVMALIAFGGAYNVSRPPKVEVGADGVKVGRFRSRFMSFEEIAGVALEDSTLTLTLHEGDPVVVKAAGNDTQMRSLQHRIQLGLAAHADAPQAPARLALLDRKKRPLDAWRGDLDQAVNDDTGYRRQPLSRDDLEAILSAPNTSTEHRIGAALAYQALDSDAAPPRIRIAAEACAEDRAREALLRIAEQEYEHRAVEEALSAPAQLEARAG